MNFFLDFLHQKAPRAGREIPATYRRALSVSATLMVVYFGVCFFLYPLINNHRWEWAPLVLAAGSVCSLWLLKHGGARVNLALSFGLCAVWVTWNVAYFGWGSGTQHFLTLLLILTFFNIYASPAEKIVSFVLILVYRVGLYAWSQNHPAVYEMDHAANTVYQTVNTVFFFLMMAVLCIVFSSGVQDTERELRIRNQMLYKEAGTDPLTGLPNRRAMVEEIERYLEHNSDQPFSVAIADIDFFKKINDTYGHKYGDYTLVKLTELFTQHSGGRYSVCRWGGEEFCFFLPGLNLDEAGAVMTDLCFAVEKMQLQFEEQPVSVTITIGVEENDFSSPMDELIRSADEKLYMGKNAGRNRVVI